MAARPNLHPNLKAGLALICWLATAPAALASESPMPEPPLSFATLEEALEGRVRLTLAAEAEPAFFRLLLNSAKSALERAREDAEEAYAVSLNAGSEAFERWSFAIQDETRLVDARALSVIRRITEYDGGPEIRARLESFVFDRKAGRPLALTDLFGDLGPDSPAMALLRKAAIDRIVPLKAERLRISEAEAREALDSALPLDGRALRLFSLAPSEEPGFWGGLGFHFGHHEIGAGQEGEYEALIPQEIFHELLAEPWREAFAGAPRALIRVQSEQGLSGAFYGLTPGETVSAPLLVRGEAPRSFFRAGAALLEVAPEHGGLLLAKAAAEALEEAPSGAVEEGVVFEARIDGLRAAQAGAPVNLRLIAAAAPDEGAFAEPDRILLPLTAGAEP